MNIFVEKNERGGLLSLPTLKLSKKNHTLYCGIREQVLLLLPFGTKNESGLELIFHRNVSY